MQQIMDRIRWFFVQAHYCLELWVLWSFKTIIRRLLGYRLLSVGISPYQEKANLNADYRLPGLLDLSKTKNNQIYDWLP